MKKGESYSKVYIYIYICVFCISLFLTLSLVLIVSTVSSIKFIAGKKGDLNLGKTNSIIERWVDPSRGL